MSEHDPLWRAVVRGDPACPDGADLAALGALLRRGCAPPAPVDLRERVRQAVADSDEADQVQALYEGELADAAARPDLQRLRGLVREQTRPPVAVDLAPKLEEDLRRLRRRPQDRLDPATRGRIWLGVLGAHVAALIALLLLMDQWRAELVGQPPEGSPRLYRTDLSRLQAAAAPPSRWQGLGPVLVSSRQDPARAEALAQRLGVPAPELLSASQNWLRRQPWEPLVDAAGVARHAARLLALLAAPQDAEVEALLRQQLPALRQAPVSEDAVLARTLRALVLVDAALLYPDLVRPEQARHALTQLPTAMPEPWQGLLWLSTRAWEWEVPVWQPEDAAGQALAALVLGTLAWREHISDCLPPVSSEPPEPGAALLGGLVLREVGGSGWRAWRERVTATWQERFVLQQDVAWLPGEVIAGPASGDAVLATALALVELQLPWRYTPLSRRAVVLDASEP